MKCKFEGCVKASRTEGLCGSHYSQKYRGRPLSPLREYKWSSFRDKDGKVCTKCEEYRTWDQYYDNPKTSDKKQSRCSVCWPRTK